jgi:hypothetical protein
MRCVTDLRYVVPPLISIIFMVVDRNMGSTDHQILVNPVLVMAYYLFLAILTFIFLSTSVNLPLTLEPICFSLLKADFSAPLTLSFFASLIFPPSLFWLVFPMLVIVSPWYTVFSAQLKRFMCWFYESLQTIPPFIVICILGRQRIRRTTASSSSSSS